MAAYLIADIEVRDTAAYDRYRKDVPATLEKYGGRFVVRGGAAKGVEGGWQPSRVVVIEFPTMPALEAWYNSAEYKPLLDLRLAATTGRVIMVEGV